VVGADILIKHHAPATRPIIMEPANPDDPAMDGPEAQILGAVYAVVRVLEAQRVFTHA
jgi:hypothetical protein